jgi:glycosyltransferase involved in cell wall biosynthesis
VNPSRIGRTKSVLFLSPERIGPDSTSPARRAVKLAEAVGERCHVTLAAPSPSQFPDGPFAVLETGPVDDQRLAAAMRRHDVVVTQTMPSPRQLIGALRHARRLVVDLFAPLALEASEMPATGPEHQNAITRWRTRELVAHLAAADLVVCGNEKQRDLLIGTALGAGLLALGPASPGAVRADRIVVVPQGIDSEPPRHTRRVLRGTGSIEDSDLVVLWAGGTWSWMDPVTPIKAIERLSARRPDLKLVFVGTAHPDPTIQRTHQIGARAAIDYARDTGLEGSRVIFSDGWLSYEDYLNVLLESDIGIATARPTLESHFASRTRVVDYLAAGLPVVCSANDVMSAFVDRHGLGCSIPPLDVDACAAALDELAASGPPPAVDRAALAPLQWERVSRPLVDYCADPTPGPARRGASLAAAVRQYPSFARAVYTQDSWPAFVRALLKRAKKLVG